MQRFANRLTDSPDLSSRIRLNKPAFNSIPSRMIGSALLALLIMRPIDVRGQAPDRSGMNDRITRELLRRVPVTLVLVDSLPASNGAVISRRKLLEPHDLILLRRGRGTSKELAAAVFTLITARDVGGDTAQIDMLIRVPDDRRARFLGMREQPRSQAAMARLRSAPEISIAGIGKVPAITIWLPSAAMRSSVKTPGSIR